MSRALLRRLLPLSPTAAGSSSRAASSYAPRRVPSSRYAPASTAAQADAAAAAAQAGAAAAEPAAGGEQGASTPPPEARGRWGLIKFGVLAAFSAALGGLGYVSFGEDPALSRRDLSLLG
jgi:mitochondrial import inner membrane translocase subunit TIM50